jgi:hypothetical protein
VKIVPGLWFDTTITKPKRKNNSIQQNKTIPKQKSWLPPLLRSQSKSQKSKSRRLLTRRHMKGFVDTMWSISIQLTDSCWQYKYANYLPVYDNTTVFPPTEPFKVTDKGSLADKAKPHLFSTNNPEVSITKLTPRIGTEIKGLQLSQLTDAQKNELALLVGERGVVVFRGQDFKDIGPQKQKEFGEYFGKLHVHVSIPPERKDCGGLIVEG